MKKKSKRFLVLFSMLGLMLVLAGCSTTPITENSTGIWDGGIILSFSRAIIFLSNLFGGNYGVGIIVFTIIIRVILLPLMIYQTKSMRKTAEVQPQLKALQAKHSGKDAATVQKLREEQQKLYAEAGINPIAGCLPLLVQMPILLALYQAILRTNVLKTGEFLWLQLGDKDPYFILPILAAILTYFVSKLGVMSQPEANSMSTIMVYGTPIMILVTAINLPSALSLYWVITNAFSVGQTLLINNPFKITREREEKVRLEKEKAQAIQKAKKKAYKGRNKK
ncbi:membrane protein insertase YidC 2 [Dellaglioa algida]|nr:membrane protein insertase YidC 2 [Dellaglioa algida]